MIPQCLRILANLVVLTASICLWGACAMAAEGVTSLPSAFGPKDTMDRLESEIKSRGIAVFARIDHAAGAAQVSMSLRPTEVLIFGNAKAGTPLMQQLQSIGIDLPLKALVWEDANGKTWLSYNEPTWIAKRHGLSIQSQSTVNVLSEVLASLARGATEP